MERSEKSVDEAEIERDRDEPVKIDLPFEDAMNGLLRVDPDADPAEKPAHDG